MCRSSLINELKVVLESDELPHMLSVLIKDVDLRVKVRKGEGDNIRINVGTA